MRNLTNHTTTYPPFVPVRTEQGFDSFFNKSKSGILYYKQHLQKV